MNNGPNGQGHDPQRPMGMFYQFLCLCREVSFLKIWFEFSWFNLQLWRRIILKSANFKQKINLKF